MFYKLLLKLFLAGLFLTGSVLPQRITVTYEKAIPPIFSEQQFPVHLGIIKYYTPDGDSLLDELLYNSLRTEEEVLKNFRLYSTRTLLQSAPEGVTEIQLSDSVTLTSLSEVVDYVIVAKGKQTEFSIDIRRTKDAKLVYNHNFINSDFSTAVKDAVKLLKSGLAPVYLKRAILNVKVIPKDAELTIDQVKTEVGKDISLLPGTHVLSVRKPGYRTEERRIEIKEGETVLESFDLEPAYGGLNIQIVPDDARIRMKYEHDSLFFEEWIGSKSFDKLQEGLYTLQINRTCYRPDSSKNIRVVADSTVEAQISLIKWFVIDSIGASIPQVRNMKIIPRDTLYEIYYDLPGVSEAKYDIKLKLFFDSAKEGIDLKGLIGHAGDNIPAGEQRKIIWLVRQDFPKGILNQCSRFYLEID